MNKKPLKIQELEEITAPMALFSIATQNLGLQNLVNANIYINNVGPLGGQGLTIGADAHITPLNAGIGTTEIGLGAPPASGAAAPPSSGQGFDLLYGVKASLNLGGNNLNLVNSLGGIRLF